MKPLSLAPSDYFRRNFALTTSGFESPEVLDLVIKVAGIENVMWAIDYSQRARAMPPPSSMARTRRASSAPGYSIAMRGDIFT